MDLASLIGLLLGITAIVGGQILEGGHLSSILQPTAALIVFGGTLGATLLSYPLPVFLSAMKGAVRIFFTPSLNPQGLIKEIIGYATKARKNGLIALEADLKQVQDPFLEKAMRLMVDGLDPKMLRETMETELGHEEERGHLEAKVFESAGAFAPTIGILGAVLGLIHVMENLSDPAKLGTGIAVAFVATVYGVGSANLLFFPISWKMKIRHRQAIVLKEMILVGVLDIQSGLNPHYIEEKLKAFIVERAKEEAAGGAGKRVGAAKTAAQPG